MLVVFFLVACVCSRIAESEVKYPTPSSTIPKFPTPDSYLSKLSDSRLLNIKGMKFDC